MRILSARTTAASVACAIALGVTSFATPRNCQAETAKFELGGRIYTKYLYRNDDSQGLLSLGNPFWPDDIAGGNGIGSEFELTVKGNVSKYVQAGARLASRFGERWQDWWESGSAWYDREENTSGDSAGMNRASYLKLRGTWVQFTPRSWRIDWVRIGSSDFGMFNPWTIGKIRYIDRDNGKGWFVSGHIDEGRELTYTLGAIAMPKLWVGPWWSTGLGDPNLTNPFWSRDWAWAGRVDWRVGDATLVKVTGSFTQDLEVDPADPDAVGSTAPNCTDALGHPIPGCAPDHAVDVYARYATANATIEVERDVGDTNRAELLLGYSNQQLDPRLTGNGVAMNQGMFPAVFKDTQDLAARVRLSTDDPFEIGLSAKFEYFNIGEDWNAIFGARREADVLLTDGFLGGGQLPTLNLANEFIDFDEAWYESCIGWHGATGLLSLERGNWRMDGEYTFLTYNTNGQSRDVDTVYPDFLHTDGYTDTTLFDYANTTDRGRDPRSVYHRDQLRRTHIAVLRGRRTFDVGRGVELDLKAKYIRDEDFRSTRHADDPADFDPYADDYKGDILVGRVALSLPVADGLKIGVGGQIDRWYEDNRRGTRELGYGDDVTEKETAFFKTSYYFAGLRAGYYLEYIHKLQHREREADQRWSVWRSKATVEVAW